MNKKAKEDILIILKKAERIVQKDDILELDKLSNRAIYDAAILQEKESIKLAIIIYGLSKIIKRSEEREDMWDKAKAIVVNDFSNAISFLEKGNEKKYRKTIKKIIRNIGKIDNFFKVYIDDVLNKARVVKGSRLYEDGVSIEKAADLLGISQWELMSYVGKTRIVDSYKEEVIPAEVRLDYAKRLFGV